MMRLNQIITNEKTYANEMLQNCQLGEDITKTLFIVAKYYYSEGYELSEVAAKLREYLLRCEPNANLILWERTIDYISKSARKHKLVEIDSIVITEKEFEFIKSIDGLWLQKLLFTLLCLGKLSCKKNGSDSYWVNFETRDIFSLANITLSNYRQNVLINTLYEQGFISYSSRQDNLSLKINFAQPDSEQYYEVCDFRNLGNQYMRLIGQPYFECKSCGLVVKQNSNHQKYCQACAEKMNRETTYIRKYGALIH